MHHVGLERQRVQDEAEAARGELDHADLIEVALHVDPHQWRLRHVRPQDLHVEVGLIRVRDILVRPPVAEALARLEVLRDARTVQAQER